MESAMQEIERLRGAIAFANETIQASTVMLETVHAEKDAEIERLRGALSKYADHNYWRCQDHAVGSCEFCSDNEHILFDDMNYLPGWLIAEEALKGGDS